MRPAAATNWLTTNNTIALFSSPPAVGLRSKMKRKIWYFYPTNTTLVAFCPILNLVCLYFLYGPGYLDDGDADRRDILHDGRAAVCPRTSFSAFGGDIFRCHQTRGYERARVNHFWPLRHHLLPFTSQRRKRCRWRVDSNCTVYK